MQTYELDKVDIDGIYVPIKDDRIIIVDKYGWELFKKYGDEDKNGWRYDFSIRMLYRIEYIKTDNKGKLKYKIILFHRELLKVNRYIRVWFMSSNKLDLRIANLYCPEINIISEIEIIPQLKQIFI
jgi:hypothetical protein